MPSHKTDILISPSIQFRTCITCQQRRLDADMLDEWECNDCHKKHIDEKRAALLTTEINDKKKALGQAVTGMVSAMAKKKIIPQEPHVLYASVMEEVGGIEQLGKLIKLELIEALNLPLATKPRKVILEYFKMLFNMSIEAQKTAPPTQDFDDMNDEELGEATARLMQEKLQEMKRNARKLKLLDNQPVPEELEAVLTEEEDDT